MKKLYFLFLLLFSFGHGKAQNWIRLGTDRQGHEFFLNTRIIDAEYENWFGVWVKYSRTDYATIKGKRVTLQREVKQLMHINCASNEMAVAQTVVYNQNGEVVKSHKEEYPDFSAVIPDTIGEQIATSACSLREENEKAGKVEEVQDGR